ncbi:MAG: 23S rRNA (adenine(2503)-C(2))-methyltransferase RlmN [Clostridiales bacterium]|jgi:23S rRNA (adenine2503-C2)-methyltransferase|nr:23S rRNA (adenine(2503)-C(2))-methyltransferase RlmN [Eubacteriales bacterium]MDH7566616.1 23S rRNA (adenine(2503)-C(2))-methyltransferase RlmN [Clostridiales bacterium]
MDDKVNLLDLSIEELQDMLAGMGQESFRAKQIFQWLHKGAGEVDEMTNLSKSLRQELRDVSFIGKFKIYRKFLSQTDGTVKYLLESRDKNIIESVLMEYRHGFTACISSQIGCRMGCRFCASTGVGFVRNLSPGEMLDQVLCIQSDSKKRVGNIVIMGIGEPLDNYDAVVKFLRLVNHPEGLNIGLRHISLSTCGLVPGILRLARENVPVTLSISLHAPNDRIREQIMPINKKHSIDKIIEACKIYTEATKRRITFEYAMISGVNDSRGNALELAGKIKGMLCHVNLIPINSIESADFRKSDPKTIEMFKNILQQRGIETTVRRELGTDIHAACGQLRRSAVSVES